MGEAEELRLSQRDRDHLKKRVRFDQVHEPQNFVTLRQQLLDTLRVQIAKHHAKYHQIESSSEQRISHVIGHRCKAVVPARRQVRVSYFEKVWVYPDTQDPRPVAAGSTACPCSHLHNPMAPLMLWLRGR